VADGADRTRDLVFQVAGAAAGIAVFVSLAGGAVTAARLHALGLPTDSTLAVLPREQVLVAGVRVLSVGLLAALLVAGILWLLNRTRALGGGPTNDLRILLGVPVLALAPLLIYTLVQPLTTAMLAVVLVTTAVAALVLVLVLRRPAGFGPLGWGFFAVVAVFGGILAFARAASPPVTLDFADVQLEDGGRTSGFLLGQSGSVVVLAPEVLNKTIGRTVAIERSQVVDLRISRVQRPVRPIGPEPVSRFTVDVDEPDERALEQTLLKIKLSAQWKHPPLVYRESVRTWRQTFDAFTEAGERPGTSGVQQTTLEDLNEQTPIFAGKLVALRARILEATPWIRRRPQTVVFRGPDLPTREAERYLGTCEVWTTPDRSLSPNDEVRIVGLVVASGVFVSGAGTERNRVAMICARPG
jgi:hypothetical protein